jgi:hypothetical protein
MPDWCREEKARLLRRTVELREITRAMILAPGPYSQEAHDDLRKEVDQHYRELIAYRKRCIDLY